MGSVLFWCIAVNAAAAGCGRRLLRSRGAGRGAARRRTSTVDGVGDGARDVKDSDRRARRKHLVLYLYNKLN